MTLSKTSICFVTLIPRHCGVLLASFLGISEALHLNVFHQPLRRWFFDSLYDIR